MNVSECVSDRYYCTFEMGKQRKKIKTRTVRDLEREACEREENDGLFQKPSST